MTSITDVKFYVHSHLCHNMLQKLEETLLKAIVISTFIVATYSYVEVGYRMLLRAVDQYVLQTTTQLEQFDPDSAGAIKAQYAAQRQK